MSRRSKKRTKAKAYTIERVAQPHPHGKKGKRHGNKRQRSAFDTKRMMKLDPEHYKYLRSEKKRMMTPDEYEAAFGKPMPEELRRKIVDSNV